FTTIFAIFTAPLSKKLWFSNPSHCTLPLNFPSNRKYKYLLLFPWLFLYQGGLGFLSGSSKYTAGQIFRLKHLLLLYIQRTFYLYHDMLCPETLESIYRVR